MVAALTLALIAASAPGPVAAFSAPVTVRTGAPVAYVDQSYDPAPGHHITLEIWISRQSSFQTPGSYPVTLVVQDDRGLMASVSHTISAVATPPPPPPPPPTLPTATLLLSETRVQRGDAIDVTLVNAPGAENPRLLLPAAFLQEVALPTGDIDYAKINRGSFTMQGGTLTTTVWVPWTMTSPANGSYTLSVVWTEGGRTQTLSASVTVAGTDRMALWTQG